MIQITAIHGFLGQDMDWNSVELSRQLNVQMRNLNLFSPANDSFSAELWAASDLESASKKIVQNEIDQRSMNHDGVKKQILIGYSMGGRLALGAFLQAPNLWDQLVLLSVHPGLEDDVEKRTRLEKDQHWSARFKKEPWDYLLKDWNQQKVFRGGSEPQRSEKDYSRGKLAMALDKWSLGRQPCYQFQLNPLRSRIHWMVGEYDESYQALYSQLFEDGVISNPLLVPKSGHRLLFDNPGAVAARLVPLLEL